MIFVSVGTTAFDTLVQFLDELESPEIFHFQIGPGTYIPKNHSWERYCEDFEQQVNAAQLIICHGGAGTLFDLVAKEKKVIGVENTDRRDPHQKDLLHQLWKEGQILWAQKLQQIPDQISEAQDFKPNFIQAPKDLPGLTKLEAFLRGEL